MTPLHLAAPEFASDHPLADAVRLVLVVGATMLMLAVLRVAFLRWKSPEGSPERARSALGLLSYGAFVAVYVYDGFSRFGQPLNPVRTPLALIGVLAGLAGSTALVQYRLRRTRHSSPPPA